MRPFVLVLTILVVAALSAADRETAVREPNWDRSKIGAYELEDPLTFLDGRKVASAADWAARRREILGVFAREMYGAEPPAPETVKAEIATNCVTCAGFAVRRRYRMSFRADGSGPSFDWDVWLPRHAKGRVPVILWLNYDGSQDLIDTRQNPDGNTIFPVGMLMAKGYAVMTARYTDVSPDESGAAYTGVFALWGERDERRTDNTTSLGAWAWALCRGLDLAERIPEIDATRNIVTGYSRLAKAALIAAARDERFRVCVPVQTGGGGCPLAKRDFGENVSTENRMFPHWFCPAYAKYAADPAKLLTFDQHLFLACVAPRALLVAGFDEPWFDTEGEYLAVKAASPVWELLGRAGLPKGAFPPDFDTSAVGPDLGYVRRSEGHGISAYDWMWMLGFAERHLR